MCRILKKIKAWILSTQQSQACPNSTYSIGLSLNGNINAINSQGHLEDSKVLNTNVPQYLTPLVILPTKPYLYYEIKILSLQVLNHKINQIKPRFICCLES
jgi:hypothetical protein